MYVTLIINQNSVSNKRVSLLDTKPNDAKWFFEIFNQATRGGCTNHLKTNWYDLNSKRYERWKVNKSKIKLYTLKKAFKGDLMFGINRKIMVHYE